jgi:hypothetical protein
VNDLVPFGSRDATELVAAGGIMSTYPSDDKASQLAVFRAVQASDAALDDLVGSVIKIQHVVVHPVRVAHRENGELLDGVRTVLIDAEGRRYSTLSPYPLRCLQLYQSVTGVGAPYSPPLSFRVCKQKRRQGDGGYLQLEPVD